MPHPGTTPDGRPTDGTGAGVADAVRKGERVRVTQQIAARHYAFVTPVEGIVIEVMRRPTGSWFAHGAADKLWLDRIVLRKDDGEVTTLNVDDQTCIDVLA